VIGLLVALLRGLIQPRFAPLCQVRCAENRQGATRRPVLLLPKPCVAGSSPAGGARKVNGIRGLGRGGQTCAQAQVLRGCFVSPAKAMNEGAAH